MKLRILGLALILAALFLASPARAQMVWDWTYTTTDPYVASYSGGGTFTTDSSTSTNGSFVGYQVTDVTGTWTEVSPATTTDTSIIGVVSPGGLDNNDNLVAVSSLQLDDDGITFNTASGTEYNISDTGGEYVAESTDNFFDSGGIFTATEVSTPVPEPYQYGWGVLLATLGFVAWRRFFGRAAHA
jgi:hypothetical protein